MRFEARTVANGWPEKVNSRTRQRREPFKTGRSAAATPSRSSAPSQLADGGGRTWSPGPTAKTSLARTSPSCEAVFGPDESRIVADMRRSGAVEAIAGGAEVELVSTKLTNMLAASTRLQKTHHPVHVARFVRWMKRGARTVQDHEQ